MITVFRLFSPWRNPWDAAGAFAHGGRWNSPGSAVLYSASSLSLACLEILVHIRNPSNFPVYSYAQLAIPEGQIELWESGDPIRSPERRQAILESEVLSREEGDIWIRERQRKSDPRRVYRSGQASETVQYVSRPLPVRQVPSAVVPQEWNYLIDPEEEVLQRGWSQPKPFRIDSRLLDPGLR